MGSFLKLLLKALKNGLLFLLYKWLVVFVRLILQFIRICKNIKDRKRRLSHRERREIPGNCAPIKHEAYKKPDPLIYSQYYLMKLGFAVTWDNPDIILYKDGVAVTSGTILPNTEYEVVARIWNASYEAPVVGMPVRFSYLDFGAGTISKPINETTVNVGVIGGSDHPAFAKVKWRTPEPEGHYCIQVQLIWTDDANPENNLGQENLTIVNPQSPAVFTFKVRNNDRKHHRYHYQVDTYSIPEKINCREFERLNKDQLTRKIAQIHSKEAYPVPQNWNIEFEPGFLSLMPGEERIVRVTIIPPENFSGKQPFNINVFEDDTNRLAGGITVHIVKE